ncbi:MAG: hypothetical protein V3S64_04820, partial [bacterium]
MKETVRWGLTALCIAVLIQGCTPTAIDDLSQALSAKPRIVAFVGVNIIPMTDPSVLPNQSVLVRDGLIVEVGPAADVAIPDNAFVVAGNGGFLLPGLADMHVHVTSKADLVLFAAHGVTTVQNMWGYRGFPRWIGFPDQKALRDQIRDGTLFGPTIVTSGPILEGSPSNHPFMMELETAEARGEALEQVEQGYDFLKVYDHLSPAAYQAIIGVGRETNVPVRGHV